MVWFLQECQTSNESYSRNSKSNERGPTMCFLGSLSENEKVLLILNSNLLLQYTQCIQLNCCAHFFIFCYISRLLWFFKQINLQLVDFVPNWFWRHILNFQKQKSPKLTHDFWIKKCSIQDFRIKNTVCRILGLKNAVYRILRLKTAVCRV